VTLRRALIADDPSAPAVIALKMNSIHEPAPASPPIAQPATAKSSTATS